MAEWKRILPVLVARRVICIADLAQVKTYCCMAGLARQIETERQLAGGVVDVKLFGVQNRAAQTARQIRADRVTPIANHQSATEKEPEMKNANTTRPDVEATICVRADCPDCQQTILAFEGIGVAHHRVVDLAINMDATRSVEEDDVTPLHCRSVLMKWHEKTVMQDRRIKFDQGIWGDETTQAAMLRHVGRKVLIGINPNDYRAPAMVRGWEETELRGRILLEMLSVFEPTKHADEASRRRAVAEERRGKKLAAAHRLQGVSTWVEEKRAEVLAKAGLGPRPEAPNVVPLDARGPFSPAAALYQKPELSQGARLLALLNAEDDERNRTASGGNR